MHTWTSRCLLGAPLNPPITQMITLKAPKMESQGLHNVSFGYKKRYISASFQQSTCQQLPVDETRGRRQGAKPLNIYIRRPLGGHQAEEDMFSIKFT